MSKEPTTKMQIAWMFYSSEQKQNAGIHGWYVKPTEFYAGWQACESEQSKVIAELVEALEEIKNITLCTLTEKIALEAIAKHKGQS